jgi:hypothetical protein
MRAFFEQIKAKINNELPDYKTVELFNGQDEALEELKEDLILYPAVYIDFEFEEVNHLSFGVKDMITIVRFRFMFENYTRGSRLDDLDKMSAFTSVFDMYRGIETDPLQFTSFHEVMRGLDKNHDMISFPFIDYKTTYRDTENYTRKNNIDVSPVAPATTGVINKTLT